MASGAVAEAPRRRGIVAGVLWGCVALAAIYVTGVAWLAVLTGSLGAAIVGGLLPFVAFDLVKVVLAALVAVAVAPAIAASRA
jgi:biotin transporter BioY